MQFLQNTTLVFFRPSANVNLSGSNIFFMQTQNGETIPFEFGLLTLPSCLDQSVSKPDSTSNTTSHYSSIHTGESVHAVVYVSVVLLVYAVIIMMMIATNIRRHHLEGEDADYYEEFLQKRDHFKYAQMVAEARMSVRQATSVNPGNPIFNVDQGQETRSLLMAPGTRPAIVIQSA